MVEVESVDIVEPSSVDAAQAREVLETARALFPKNPLLEAAEKNLNHKLAR